MVILGLVVVCSSLFNTTAAFAVNIKLAHGTVPLKYDLQGDL